jgi:Fe-S-cluster containining protein
MTEKELTSGSEPEDPQMATYTIRLETPDGPRKGRVSVYTGPTPLAGLVPPLLALTEGLVSATIAQAGRMGKTISCRPGCSACCRQMVPLAIPEAFYLSDLIASLPPDRRQMISPRFERIVTELDNNGFYERISNPDNTEDDYQIIAQEYLYLRLPCPFLEQDRCSIYPLRPMACREYHVTSPPEWCADPRSHKIESLKPRVALPVILTRLSGELLDVRPRLVPLSLAVRFASEHAGLHRRTWPGKMLFEEFLARFHATT